MLSESVNRSQTTLPYTHEELAASVGLNRVTVSRVISNLKKQNLVRTSYRTIQVCDASRLEEILHKNDV